jgi:hypothetical protein
MVGLAVQKTTAEMAREVVAPEEAAVQEVIQTEGGLVGRMAVGGLEVMAVIAAVAMEVLGIVLAAMMETEATLAYQPQLQRLLS